MALDIDTITDKIVSYAASLGYFDQVNAHEPKSAPGHGLSVAVWFQSLSPLGAGSGLRSTTALLEMNLRIYTNMLQKPEDMIDPNMVKAADALIQAFSGDFTFGDNIRNVDLLGSYSQGLRGEAGYIPIDKFQYRTFTISIPLVVNDVWDQVA